MMIRLDMNENPYEPPENVLDAVAKGIRNVNRYSELKYLSELQKLIGIYNTVSPDRVIVSPGSDFLLRQLNISNVMPDPDPASRPILDSGFCRNDGFGIYCCRSNNSKGS